MKMVWGRGKKGPGDLNNKSDTCPFTRGVREWPSQLTQPGF